MRLSLGLTPKSYFNLGVAANDADAQAFITAAGITDATQKSAVNQLVLDLKSANIWTKFKAIYPIVGGTSTTHKWNLKDPRDLDAAFRLTFATGFTHSSTGMLPNGSSAYANTNFIPSINGTLDSSHFSFYSRTNSDGIYMDIGANNALGSAGASILYVRSTNILYATVDYFPSVVGDYLQFTNTDSLGFYCASRTASNINKAYKNGILKNTNSKTGNRSTKAIFISALNKDNPDQVNQYSNRQCAFASIGDGLTDTESSLLYQITEKYQVALGRNV